MPFGGGTTPLMFEKETLRAPIESADAWLHSVEALPFYLYLRYRSLHVWVMCSLHVGPKFAHICILLPRRDSKEVVLAIVNCG